MKLSILIPVFNEELSLEQAINNILEVELPREISKELIIINDGSTDKTVEILDQFEKNPSIKIFHLRENIGKSAAVKKAIEKSTGDILLIQDADLEYLPEHYPALIQPILDKKAHVVYGSRFKGSIQGMKPINRIANVISNIIFNLLYGTNITDINTCYKVFEKNVIKYFTIESNVFMMETEITAKITKSGIKICEVPIDYVARSKEEGKKINWPKAIHMFWGIIKYFFIKRQQVELSSDLYSRDFFLKINDGFKEFQDNRSLSYNKKKELSYLKIEKSVKFLDIGYGRGDILYHCHQLGVECYGIDFSPDACNIAKEALKDCPGVTLLQGDCSKLPFEDNFFDRILLADVIEHLSFSKGTKLMREVSRVLSPGGIFLLHTSPNATFMKYIYPLFIRCLNKKKKQEVIDHVNVQSSVHINEYSYFSLKKLAKESGMKAKIWIDDDITRGGKFRHLKELTKPQQISYKIIKFIERLRFFPLKLLINNDMWLLYQKD